MASALNPIVCQKRGWWGLVAAWKALDLHRLIASWQSCKTPAACQAWSFSILNFKAIHTTFHPKFHPFSALMAGFWANGGRISLFDENSVKEDGSRQHAESWAFKRKKTGKIKYIRKEEGSQKQKEPRGDNSSGWWWKVAKPKHGGTKWHNKPSTPKDRSRKWSAKALHRARVDCGGRKWQIVQWVVASSKSL